MGGSSQPSRSPSTGLPLLAVVIGASAGGPAAIEAVLSALPWNFPVPIAVCQHMTEGATATWAERLNSACHLRVIEAQQNVPFSAHRAYIAPIGCHMRIRGSAEAAHISLEPDLASSTYVPSIDELMRSVATVFGARSLGVVLTGMGSDGAQGLLAIREVGGVTLAQPSESAFVGSMPVAAAEIGAVEEVVPLARMAETITERVAGRM